MWLFLSLLTSISSNMCSPQIWQDFVEQAENSDSINWQEIKHQDSMLSCLLQNAIAEKNVKLAELLLQNGADVDTTTKRADNPLMLAILEQDKEIIQLLLDLGADPWYLEPENIKSYLLSKPTFFRTDIPIFLRNNQFRINKN